MMPVGGSDISPWRSIWRSPALTIRNALGSTSTPTLLFLGAVGGVAQAFAREATKNSGVRVPAWALVAGAILVGSTYGVLQLYLLSTLLYWTGRLTGAVAPLRSVQIVVGWSNAPFAANLVLWLVATPLVGRHLFVFDPTLIQFESPARSLLVGFAWLMTMCTFALSGAWSMLILVQGMAEVNGFSVWRALGILVLALLTVTSTVFLVVPIVAHVLRH
ncbi:MAG: hypothetical protein DMD33_19375 [Gemmatimonadetes bacterium]|nr:MAG: hypothetical protein DMD33_19375 [Gemmatimonadota bacterium]